MTASEIADRHFIRAEVRVDTFNAEERTVEIIWAAGAAVKRYSWDEGYYMEELSMDPAHIRMQRFSSGMSLLDSHESWSMDARLGTVIPNSVRIEGGKGYARVKLSRKQRAEELLQDLKDGHPFPVSVGYRTHAVERRDGDSNKLPTLRAIDWEPMELSAVPVPADAGAHSRSAEDGHIVDCLVVRHEPTAASRAAPRMEIPMDKREAAKKFTGDQLDAFGAGFGMARNKDETDEAFRARMLAKFDSDDADAQRRAQEEATRQANATQQQPAPAPAPDAAAAEATRRATDEALAAERKRISDIRSIAARHDLPAEMVDKGITAGTSVADFRSQVLDYLAGDSERSTNQTSVDTRGGQDEVSTRRAAIANALLHRYDSSRFQLTDAGREWRHMNLMEIVKEQIRAAGGKTRGMSEVQIAERAFHSTSDFPIILGDVVRTTLLDGYKAYPNTFQLIAKRNVVPNFKEIRRARLGENPELKKVNESGEFPRGTMVEGVESYKIATYGRIIGMTRQMLINDDLNAFADVPRRWGRQVAKLEGDIVWGMVVNNAKMSSDGLALFHATHGNLAGSGTVLGVTGLTIGRTSFRKQTDIDGNRIDLVPKYLFVPTDLEVKAQQLLQSTTTPATTDQVVPEAIRSLIPVAEHRLDAISATVWFLFADPADTDGGLEYAYLAGNEAPFTEDRIGFDVDGVEYKVRHDFGAGLTDWRFAYKNPGAAS